MNLDEFNKLPESTSGEQLEGYFNDLLDYAENQAAKPLEISKALCKLADKQWHTYELIDEQLKIKLELWIKKSWNISSENLVKNLISIIAYLGLTNSFELLKEALSQDLDPGLKKVIKEAVDELQDNIADPYSGMK